MKRLKQRRKKKARGVPQAKGRHQHGTRLKAASLLKQERVQPVLSACECARKCALHSRRPVGGVEKWVLAQLFERRVLTYTPDNPQGWHVEMGNVGQHYYTWRYGTQPWKQFP